MYEYYFLPFVAEILVHYLTESVNLIIYNISVAHAVGVVKKLMYVQIHD